jgi:PAS domain S-box-containing protein
MGKPHLLAVVRDITDRERAEEQYRNTFEASIDAIVIADLQGNIVEANPAACQMYGYAHDELVGQPASALIAPENLALVGQAVSSALEGRTNHASGMALRKDGARFPTEASATGFTYMGRPHILGVVRDITERVQVEEQLREKETQYRRIFEATTDSMTIITMDGVVVEVNPAHYTMFGYTRDEMVGKRFTTLVHPDYRQYAAETFASAVSGGSPEGQILCVRKDGRLVHIEGRATVFQYMGKAHVLSVLRDVTEKVMAEE